jgi:hypothetical protein
MTLPASGPISMSQVSVELGLAANYPLSLNNSWVRYLGQVAQSGVVSFLNLLGKTATYNGPAPSGVSGAYAIFPSPPWFGGVLQEIDVFGPSGGNEFLLWFSQGASLPNWPNNIKVTNLTTGVSAVFTPVGNGYQWQATPWQANLVRSNVSDTFLVQPT